MRGHEKRSEKDRGGSEDASEGSGMMKQGQMARMQQRRQAQQIKDELCNYAMKAANAVSIGGNLFQAMVRKDGEEELQKKLEPAAGERIKDYVIDKLCEKLRSGLAKVTGVGEEIAEKSSAVFGTIKEIIKGHIDAQKDLTVLQVADSISAAITEKSLELQETLTSTIKKLPQEKLLAIRKELKDVETAAMENSNADTDDSPDRGNLKEGVRERAMTELLGMPEGDLVAAEDLAFDSYTNFKIHVAMSGTVAETVDAISHQKSHPNEGRDKLEEVEGDMGSKFKHDLQRDKTQRSRVDQVLE